MAIKQILILLLTLLPALLHGQTLPEDGVKGIVEAFQHYPVVAIGEIHSIQQAGDFYDSLVRDPGFQQRVNDIVIEFASRRSQPILDRYINGEDVPQDELRQVWRNTTKVFAFESPIYAYFLETVREVNTHMPPSKRLRVLAGDSWIDWSTVTTHEQWESLQPNNRSFAYVIEREVLDKGHRALVILGNGRLMKDTDPNREPNATMLVERAHPGSMYVVRMTARKPAATSSPAPPVLLPWPPLRLPNGQKMIAGSYADALLYLGPALTPAPPNWAEYRNEPEYMEQLNRRARIEWGCNFILERFENGAPPCSQQ